MPKARYLVIEDDPFYQKYIADLLDETGVEILSALDGEEGLLLAREKKPDLILSDIEIPKIQGFLLLRTLKESPETRDIPVILMSGKVEKDLLDRLSQLNVRCEGTLVKPFSGPDLMERIKAVFEPGSHPGQEKGGATPGDGHFRKEAAGDPKEKVDGTRSIPAPLGKNGKVWCVFAVDDSPFILNTVSEFLSESGFEVHTFFKGEDVLKKVVDLKPDLFLIDVQMPGIGGFVMCEMLRKEESGSHAGGSAETSRLRARLRALLRDLIEEGRRAGQIEAVDPARAADWVLGAIEGAALGYIETGEKPERGSIELDRFVAFVWGGLARVPASMGILAGRRILVTREERPREGLSREIERLGGRAVLCPLVRTLPPRDEAALERAARQAAAFDWILFTSVRGVEAFSRARGRRACPIPESARLGAVGEATAEAARRRFGRVDLVAPLAGGAGLAAALIDRSPLSGCRVLLPRAELGHPDLPRLLREHGARVEEVAAYRTVPVEAVPEEIPGLLANGEIAAVAFASGSAVEAFAALFGAGALRREGRRFAVVSIGGSTSAKVESLGGRVDAEADQPSLEHLARAAAAGLESRAAAAGAAGPAAIRREETYR